MLRGQHHVCCCLDDLRNLGIISHLIGIFIHEYCGFITKRLNWIAAVLHSVALTTTPLNGPRSEGIISEMIMYS